MKSNNRIRKPLAGKDSTAGMKGSFARAGWPEDKVDAQAQPRSQRLSQSKMSETSSRKLDMKSSLASKECTPCKEGTAALKGAKLRDFKTQLPKGWKIVKEHHLEKEFKFKNFVEALAFTNRIGEIAEQEQHHPDIYLTWGKVRIETFTHKVDGLTENDFILAAKMQEAES